MPNEIANNMADTIHFLEEDNASMMKSLTNLQLAYNEQMIELREAKRLLKLAVEDLEELHSEADCSCNCCKGEKAESCQFIKCWTWRYADEALKLIGGSENENNK